MWLIKESNEVHEKIDLRWILAKHGHFQIARSKRNANPGKSIIDNYRVNKNETIHIATSFLIRFVTSSFYDGYKAVW